MRFCRLFILASSALIILLGGCASEPRKDITMPDFSSGKVTVGDLVLNPHRIGEPEPPEVGSTIHNQMLLIQAEYKDGSHTWNADYDLLFGPYPNTTPNTGELTFVEGPNFTPEGEVIVGYAVCGGSYPVIRAKNKRAVTDGTRFAVWVKESETAIYVLINLTGAEKVEVTATTAAGTATEWLDAEATFVVVSTPGSGAPHITSPKAVSADAEVDKFYKFAVDKADEAAVRP